MKKTTYTLFSVLIFAIILASTTQCSSTKARAEAQSENTGEAEKFYAEYCASCHGREVEEFVDREKWVYGESRDEMLAVIKNGAEKDGMPAYGEVLSDAQVKDLVNYILAAVEDKKSAYFNAGTKDDVVFVSEGIKLKLELIADNANSVWSITQSADGTLFYTDKEGKLFAKKEDQIDEIKGVPFVKYRNQGGLMDVDLHPDFENNKRLYLSYSKPNPMNAGEATTAIYSAILEDNRLKKGKDIFVAKPYVSTNHHYGCRMIFDNDGYLFVAIGERGRRDEHPQFLDNDLGKIHRLNDDGSVPTDNPFYNVDGANNSIFSFGHRNPQGLCYHAETGKIYEQEHGPKGGDEINLIETGKNYGWPVITYGVNYTGTKITDITQKEGMEQPLRYWVPSIAPCGMEIVTSDKYPAWQGNILSGSLKFDYLHRDVFDENDNWLREEKLFPNIGRMRSVEQCADGFIYFGTEEPGKLWRIVPL